MKIINDLIIILSFGGFLFSMGNLFAPQTLTGFHSYSLFALSFGFVCSNFIRKELTE